MKILRCSVSQIGSAKWWMPLPGNCPAVFMVDGAVKADLREYPPYLQIIPCPYCGAKENADHDAQSHVDPRLGVPANV